MQSTSDGTSCPTVESLSMALLKLDIINCWLSAVIINICFYTLKLKRRLLTNHRLPFASSTLVPSKCEVGLKTHLSGLGNGRIDLSTIGIVDAEGDTSASEKDLEEDLGVKSERR